MPESFAGHPRETLQILMQRTVDDQRAHGNWRYRAVRPQLIPENYIPGAYIEADCSDGVRCLARWAVVTDDPAGNGYQPWGNSSSIWAHLHHIQLEQVQPGDLFTFGKWTGESHVAMAWAKHGAGFFDWDVWNLGTQGQPARKTLAFEMAGHKGMTLTACQLNLPPDPDVTPPAVLRAKTGFYAWLAWQLGEGEWRPYGMENRAVRPNVPKLISAAWWARRLQFLLARKKPVKATG